MPPRINNIQMECYRYWVPRTEHDIFFARPSDEYRSKQIHFIEVSQLLRNIWLGLYTNMNGISAVLYQAHWPITKVHSIFFNEYADKITNVAGTTKTCMHIIHFYTAYLQFHFLFIHTYYLNICVQTDAWFHYVGLGNCDRRNIQFHQPTHTKNSI